LVLLSSLHYGLQYDLLLLPKFERTLMEVLFLLVTLVTILIYVRNPIF
jgi:hypothetical protein